jgi:tetratricopeptide (TPR) repeat protein
MNLQDLLQSVHHALSIGQIEQAKAALQDGVRIHGRDPGLVNAMAIASYHGGQMEQAAELFREVAETTESVEAICNYGMILVDTEQFQRALTVLQPIESRADGNAMVQFTLGRAWAGLHQPEAARNAVSQAIALAPRDVDFRLYRAQLFVEADNWDLALRDIHALTAVPLQPSQRLHMAGLLMQTGQFEQAGCHYRTILQQTPHYFEAALGLAAATERANDLPAMKAAVGQAAALVQNDQQRAALAHLQGKLAVRQKDFTQACAYLETAWAMPAGSLLWRSQVGFDLAQCQDKCNRFADAWATLNAAHALRNRKHAGSKGDRQQLDFFRMLAAPLPVQWPKPLSAADGHVDPIFVVGFPRSGTTLLEQILDARESLVSFDEQPFLAKTLLHMQSMGVQYPERLAEITEIQIQQLRAYYFQQCKVKVPDQAGRRLVDKNPLNWARIPLIRALFPQAKIILALRHPCDVILSCYMQNLRSTVLEGAFSNFERIADLYISLVAYWQRLQPTLDMPVLLSRYEDLVSDPSPSTRRIAEFLGLEWSESWLDNASHARGKAIIHTPSYAQVMEPLNQRAVGRWLNYRPYFNQALMEKLQPTVEVMGYRMD